MNIKEMLTQHKLWLDTKFSETPKGVCFSIKNADLRGESLRSAKLQNVNLPNANLRGADLRCVNLRNANLQGADLRDCLLQDADFRQANLKFADLRNTNVNGADFREANLYNAKLPAPTVMLLANWYALSEKLTAQALKFNSQNHPNQVAFQDWCDGGEEPYAHVNVQRCVIFKEVRDCWDSKTRPLTAYALMIAILNERCVITR